MILVIDNLDSFTYNLVDYLEQLGKDVRVVRNTESLSLFMNQKFEAVVLSPGPKSPFDSGNLMEALGFYKNTTPILGICLGHQAIGLFFGCELIVSMNPKHGMLVNIKCSDDVVFKRIPNEIKFVRYNSLVLRNIPKEIEAIAFSDENEIMALKHKTLPIYGFQFHPESTLSKYGKTLLANWLDIHGLISKS